MTLFIRPLPRNSAWMSGVARLASVCARLGDIERSRTLYDLVPADRRQEARRLFARLLAGEEPPPTFETGRPTRRKPSRLLLSQTH